MLALFLLNFEEVFVVIKYDEAPKKRGRPRKNSGRIRQYRLRMTDEELMKMQKLSDRLGISMADFIRRSVSLYENTMF